MHYSHYRMHTYRPVYLRDEIPKEGGFGPPRAVMPWKKKKKKKQLAFMFEWSPPGSCIDMEWLFHL
jgi:hypothetical protein